MSVAALPDSVCKYIKTKRLLRPGDRVLIAVSGGADSVALMHALYKLRGGLGLVLCVAHFDHQLRPDSQEDLEFVRRAAASLDLPFFCGSEPVARLAAKSGRNLEETARLRRRAFLKETAAVQRFNCVALGHTMDDQAETVLLNLLRGAGPVGLGAMPARQGLWRRPLLGARRCQVRQFIESAGVPFREDPTNQDVRFARNRIRLRLLPLLEKEFSRAVVERLSTLAEIEQGAAAFWRRRARRLIARDARGAFLPSDLVSTRPTAEQREAVRCLIALSRGSLRRITFLHTESVRLLCSGPGGRKVTLPGGWTAACSDHALRVFREDEAELCLSGGI